MVVEAALSIAETCLLGHHLSDHDPHKNSLHSCHDLNRFNASEHSDCHYLDHCRVFVSTNSIPHHYTAVWVVPTKLGGNGCGEIHYGHQLFMAFKRG